MLHIKVFTFNPFQQNTCLLYNDAGACCIIDPGCYYEYEQEALSDFMEEKQLTPSASAAASSFLSSDASLAPRVRAQWM